MQLPLQRTSLPPLSLDQWALLEEDHVGELVDGQLEEEEMASHVHELVVGFLIATLRAWAPSRGGFVGGSEAKFAVTSTRGRKPDVYVYIGPLLPKMRAPISHTPPYIMVEVVTPTPRDTRRDRIEKMREYAAFGVKYYWIVMPEFSSLEIFELGADRRYVVAAAQYEGKVDVPGCDGLILDLDAMWSEVEQLLAATGESH